MEATWDDLFTRAEKMYHGLEKARRIAFFEVVYAPVALIAHANRMYISGEYSLLVYAKIDSLCSWTEQSVCESGENVCKPHGGESHPRVPAGP